MLYHSGTSRSVFLSLLLAKYHPLSGTCDFWGADISGAPHAWSNQRLTEQWDAGVSHLAFREVHGEEMRVARKGHEQDAWICSGSKIQLPGNQNSDISVVQSLSCV